MFTDHNQPLAVDRPCCSRNCFYQSLESTHEVIEETLGLYRLSSSTMDTVTRVQIQTSWCVVATSKYNIGCGLIGICSSTRLKSHQSSILSEWWKKWTNTFVAEPISTSTPQMIYKVKRVSNDSQKDYEGNKGEVTNITNMTIYCRFYKGVKFVRGESSARWLVSVASMVEIEEKQLDDRVADVSVES